MKTFDFLLSMFAIGSDYGDEEEEKDDNELRFILIS